MMGRVKRVLAAIIVLIAALPVGDQIMAEVSTKQSNQPPKPVDRMVFVPAGNFIRGCIRKIQGRCDEDEWPAKEVYLDAYFIDAYEVTNEEYNMCIGAGACTRPFPRENFDGPKQPVGGVTWFQAASYCSWAGKRLPTEAEWEKAARGTDARTYPWGNTKPDCNTTVFYYQKQDACGYFRTFDVGSKPAGVSPYGAYDMAGNVWEWVNDWYSVDYYDWGPDRNPKGPENGLYRIFRGGSWENDEYYLRTCYRVKIMPNYRHHHIGFRCARTP